MSKENKNKLSMETEGINTDMYFVSVYEWYEGSGKQRLHILVKNMNDAVILKQALEKVYPMNFGSEIGNEKKYHRIEIKIENAFKRTIINYFERRW